MVPWWPVMMAKRVSIMPVMRPFFLSVFPFLDCSSEFFGSLAETVLVSGVAGGAGTCTCG